MSCGTHCHSLKRPPYRQPLLRRFPLPSERCFSLSFQWKSGSVRGLLLRFLKWRMAPPCPLYSRQGCPLVFIVSFRPFLPHPPKNHKLWILCYKSITLIIPFYCTYLYVLVLTSLCCRILCPNSLSLPSYCPCHMLSAYILKSTRDFCFLQVW